eukprot:SAG31_NODE_9311_length_1300_cov_1.161532_2_plen_60_part_01
MELIQLPMPKTFFGGSVQWTVGGVDLTGTSRPASSDVVFIVDSSGGFDESIRPWCSAWES